MKLNGSHTIDAPREKVFEMLQDQDVLAKATPGVNSMEMEREGCFKANLSLGIGPVKGSFDGTVEITEKEAPESMTLAVEGQGGPGGVKAVGKLRLEEQEDKTVIHWEGTPRISGRIASVGARLVGGVAKKLAGQFFDSISEQAKTYGT